MPGPARWRTRSAGARDSRRSRASVDRVRNALAWVRNETPEDSIFIWAKPSLGYVLAGRRRGQGARRGGPERLILDAPRRPTSTMSPCTRAGRDAGGLAAAGGPLPELRSTWCIRTGGYRVYRVVKPDSVSRSARASIHGGARDGASGGARPRADAGPTSQAVDLKDGSDGDRDRERHTLSPCSRAVRHPSRRKFLPKVGTRLPATRPCEVTSPVGRSGPGREGGRAESAGGRPRRARGVGTSQNCSTSDAATVTGRACQDVRPGDPRAGRARPRLARDLDSGALGSQTGHRDTRDEVPIGDQRDVHSGHHSDRYRVYNQRRGARAVSGRARGIGRTGLTEIIVVDDASTDDTAAAAAGHARARLAPRRERRAGGGPQSRRTAGPRQRFCSSSMPTSIVAPGRGRARDARAVGTTPTIAAVFGSYDASPRCQRVVSQYRNLLHHFVHQERQSGGVDVLGGVRRGPARRRSTTVGGLRRRRASGGRRSRTSSSAIASGARATASASTAIFRCTHLKRWRLPVDDLDRHHPPRDPVGAADPRDRGRARRPEPQERPTAERGRSRHCAASCVALAPWCACAAGRAPAVGLAGGRGAEPAALLASSSRRRRSRVRGGVRAAARPLLPLQRHELRARLASPGGPGGLRDCGRAEPVAREVGGGERGAGPGRAVRRHRGGAGGTDGGVRAAPSSVSGPSCSRRSGSSAGSPAPRTTRASTSTWAAIASSPRSTRSKQLWHEVLGERLPPPPAAVAHLLRRQVLPLPAASPGTRCAGLGPWQSVLIVLELPPLAALPLPRGGDLRAVGDQPLRPAALRDLLQDLHGEGLGHPLLRAEGRVGGAADQGPLAADGRCSSMFLKPQQDDHDPDRGVRLPAPRARA